MPKFFLKAAKLTIVLLAFVLAKTSHAAPVPADANDALSPQKQQPLSKPPAGGLYTTRYDHIDVENILNQKRLVYYYAECLLDRGPCPPQGLEFKRILPEALRTNCLYCTPKQRYVTYRSIRRLRKEYPEVWTKLAAIWDPTGDYFIQLEQSVIDDKSTNIQLPSRTTSTDQQYSTTTSSYIQKIPSGTRRTIPIELVIRTTTTPTTTTYRPSTYPPVSYSSSTSASSTFGQSSEDAIFVADRFGSSSDVLPSKPEFAIASTTTIRSINTAASSSNSLQPTQDTSTSAFVTSSVYAVPIIITSKPVGNVLPTVTAVKRINISIDGRPFSRPPGTIPTPINNLILGTNQILGSLTDIASKVIVTGNNLAGMVLNTVQNVFVG